MLISSTSKPELLNCPRSVPSTVKTILLGAWPAELSNTSTEVSPSNILVSVNAYYFEST